MKNSNGKILGLETMADTALKATSSVGARICRRRKSIGMKQASLAHEAGISAAQLCHIEKDRVQPSLRTLGKIATALGIQLGELIDKSTETNMSEEFQNSGATFPGDILSSDALTGGKTAAGEFMTSGRRQENISALRTKAESQRVSVIEPVTGMICVHDPRDSAVDRRVRGRLAKEIAARKKLEREAGIDGHLTLPLFFPSAAEFGALLAREVRGAAGIGPAAIIDPVAWLEDAGLRIIETKLPAGLDSWSVWDPHDGNAFVFLRAASTSERKRFRLAFEMGHLARLVSGGFRPLRDVGVSKRISRAFAAALLLPEEAVRAAAHSLALEPGGWTWELLLLQKERFVVSAETYLYRIEELGMLAPAERARFRARLKEHCAQCRASERKDFEPHPRARAGKRLAGLKELARMRRG